MILLDTVVLSELRKNRPAPAVVKWLGNFREDQLYLSVVSLGEIERSIALKSPHDPQFASLLTDWLDVLQRSHADRILPVTPAIARCWGKLSAHLRNGSTDLLIAATALVHGLSVATRNVKHFGPSGVKVVNPFDVS